MNIHDALIAPFTDHGFMARALAACVILSCGCAPLGVFLTLRRMALMGDAMAHAILPGVSLVFLLSGMALFPLTVGGLITGVLIALFAVYLTRKTQLKEDSSFALLYLLSIASGTMIINVSGTSVDLTHLLFGDILAIDHEALTLMTVVAIISLGGLAVFYRNFVLDGFDPEFASTVERGLPWGKMAYFALLAINLVAAFQALGTLMALGLMILPALTARFWTANIDHAIPASIGFAMLSAPIGLLLAWHFHLPAGASVVMAGGVIALLSAIFGRYGSILRPATAA